MKVYQSVLDLIGNTPLLELVNIEKKYNLKTKIFAKLESYNPAGSIKDRTSYQMILDAESKGLLKEGSTIIEPTSGNTGIGLALIGSLRKYQVIIIMPSNMSKERIALMKAYGASVILMDAKLGMQGCVDKANELNKEIKDSIILGQFTNPSNPLVHYLYTGKEIYDDLDGKIDIFIAGIGTGGTISGAGKYLKEKNEKIKVIGVEPLSSPLLTNKKTGPHLIQGIGPNFIPETLDTSIYDKIITISNEEAYEFCKEASLVEGVFVGVSSGASLCAAIKEGQKEENKNKNIVVIFPDTGSRYYSLDLYKE